MLPLALAGPYAWGETSSEQLHEVLREKFERSACVELPNWPHVHADVTVWTRRACEPAIEE